MRKQRHLVLLGLIGLLVMTSVPVDVVAQLTLDWSDDFSDGNYDGWTVASGGFSVTAGKLTITDLAPGPALPVIHHPSNTSFGNWSFDVEIGDDPETTEHVFIDFMRDVGGTGYFGGVGDTVIYMEYISGLWYFGDGFTPDYSFSTVLEWEHHIRIQRTRAEPNSFKVYHNGTLALDALLIVYPSNFSYFSFLGTRGATIDNIVVEFEPEIITSSTTTTTPTTTTTTTTTTSEPTTTPEPTDGPDMTLLLIVGGGVAVVIVVIALVVKMRS